MGDFNSICSSDERIGGNYCVPNSINPYCIEFNNFIYNMDLLDLPFLGRRFT